MKLSSNIFGKGYDKGFDNLNDKANGNLNGNNKKKSIKEKDKEKENTPLIPLKGESSPYTRTHAREAWAK